MRQIEAMKFRGALKILGHYDYPVLEKINKALGGAVLAAGVVALTGPTATPLVAFAAIWGWVDQKNEAVGLTSKLLGSMFEWRKQLGNHERTELVTAAHTVLVTSSLMEVLREQLGSREYGKLKLSPEDQLYLTNSQGLLDQLYGSEVPSPSAGVGFYENVERVAAFHRGLLDHFLSFVRGLEVWQEGRLSTEAVLKKAEARYRSRYVELAAKVPEFMVWALLGEGGATRAQARQQHQGVLAALAERTDVFSRLESLLTVLATGEPVERKLAESVRRAALSELDEPVVPRGSAELVHGQDIRFPLIKEIYVEPFYRVKRFEPDDRVSDERWWDSVPVFRDLDLRLTAHFSTADATRLPLVLLGHPGAGKSLLTKILAARLPSVSFTTVHVPLRHVTADAPIYHQIQEALDRSTHGRVNWHALTEQSDGTARVVLLDGLDELLQATTQNRAAFLHDVTEFQRREAAQHRPVVVVVTSRSIVADRVDIPHGTVVVKLESFAPQQVQRWQNIWNTANGEGIERGTTMPLTPEAIEACGELAGQPLLLLMVALYSADPANRPIRHGISHTALYRRLLDNFARREATKSATTSASAERDHLRGLSVAALAMFNRGRQHVVDFELVDDLKALGLVDDRQNAGDLFAQFFFIHTAQTVSGDRKTVRSYEFLHATFGEYLVAAEVVEVLLEVSDSGSSRRGAKELDDSQLFALLSHQCLVGRQSILTFAAGIVGELGDSDRDAVESVLHTLIPGCRSRRGSDVYADYRPTPVDRVREIAMYTANLVLLGSALGDGVPLARLWPDEQRVEQWRSMLSLWRAGMDDNGWRAMLSALDLSNGTLLLSFSQSSAGGSPALMHAFLSGDVDLIHTLRMGFTVRNTYSGRLSDSPAQAAAREELARWIVPLLLFQRTYGQLEPDRLTVILRSIGDRLGTLTAMVGALLVHHVSRLSNEVVTVLAHELSGVERLRYELFTAVVGMPALLFDVPELRDPTRYNKIDAFKVLRLRSERARAGIEEPADLEVFYDGVESHWRQLNSKRL